MDFWQLLYIIDGILFIATAGTVLYLGIFSIASLFNRTSVLQKAKKQKRIVVLIPAYKQDAVIEHTVISILGQAYPQRMFDVTVISDHQDEMTNMRLAQYPITLLTPNFEESTKAKSLQYAILNLPEFKIYDIALVLDADNIVEQDFLENVNNAFDVAATKAIQLHRISRNRDTAAARMDAIFEEINNAIFRKGHINLGLSSAIAGSGTAYDFTWFKTNVMRTKTSGEDKELEALLLRQEIFIDYFDHIYVYGEKKRSTAKLNEQRGRWASQQLHNFIRNIRFLPGAIFRKQYDLADKIIQWMLVPRTTLMGIIMVMSIVLPFIYVTLVIKWWILGALALFFFALATPDYLVDEMWDKTFLRSPFVSLWGLINVRLLGKRK
ncbi:Glycosyltransferase, catalytic subunit of cellulose synthase and poly-beta-1,6-N-acetylglucosamine synthase [Prevotella aff. ruminicola Tc2-24]|jgi:cellulose synthase/poly-beta-1,6-N-acetylglucosamine synthase-like glycosyltransferase|uniref:Glycosyltransferase, catalytic subunit of cellulose synthase and poly-beta-1,6-N-acetylglucosamine synthase n=1 Tax=Prevotella aff. ruminicola Tc2-24 TaxID=81582 RepID=A0A1I0MGG9_9BACT|nr:MULTISPECIES: glycosyltransferase family 2 protein [Prevotella]MBR5989226.1 glycosyltransferase family 2 protein [Prevotella sp.]SEE11474.1 Glycosyltransferase, catalytic subunit of cellulose synthase and poly-beta-1,6-N-acetylglucosamine synthase [Prevotella sp. lc2012]SEV87064.1 Glycosyltransferase, catalytic subunit of cellulose synthase and poly-beta-1,6-N-acetylglucosamine synthase [Prevotella aff. ruminicola Tc2-24]